MNKFKIYLLAAFTFASLTACSDFFEPIPGVQYDVNDTFSSRSRTEQYLNNVYSYIREVAETAIHPGNDHNYPGAIFTEASIEAGNLWNDRHKIWNNGSVTAGSDFVKWPFQEYYQGIAKASTFMQNVDKCHEAPAATRARWKAEARALRAYFYFELFRAYGPIPLIGEDPVPTDVSMEDILKERNTVDQCVEYIATELQKAIDTGDLNQRAGRANLGRMDVATCKALIAKLYLYWASPLFNGNTDYATITNNDGTHLFPQTPDATKWTKARDAYAEFFRFADAQGYALAEIHKNGKLDAYASCRAASEFFTNTWEGFDELIFVKMRDLYDYIYWTTPKFNPAPQDNSVSGGGGFYTTQEMADLFFTKDGLTIYQDPTYDHYEGVPTAANFVPADDGVYTNPADPNLKYFDPSKAKVLKQWKDREARFYINITYSGSLWINRGIYDEDIVTDLTYGGNCGRGASSGDCPPTGYIVRKGTVTANNDKSKHFNPILRMADMYLGYAEALCMSGDLDNALPYLNKIRYRAGIPEYSFTASANTIECPKQQTELMNRIRRERLIELAFEWNHFFDVRRWKVADGTGDTDNWIYPKYRSGGEGGNIHGMNMTESDEKFFEKIEITSEIRTSFDKKYYFLPIPDEDIRRVPQLVQNYGWKSE